MTWVKLDDAFYDHPKSRAVGKDGRALFIAALCHSSAQLTDGLIADHDLPLVAAKAEVRPATAHRLVEADRWHREGHGCDRCPPCPPSAYLIHDYHAFQPSAEAERKRRREVSEVKARAGRMGAAARWGHGTDDGRPMAHGMAQRWHTDGPVPDPEPPGVTSSAAATTSLEGRRLLEQAAAIIGDRAAQRPGTRDPVAAARATIRTVIAEHAHDPIDTRLTAQQLADQLEPARPQLSVAHPPPVDEVLADRPPEDWAGGREAIARLKAERRR